MHKPRTRAPNGVKKMIGLRLLPEECKCVEQLARDKNTTVNAEARNLVLIGLKASADAVRNTK